MALLFYYATAYLAARVLVRTGSHLALVRALSLWARGSASRLCLGIMGITFLFSCAVPNLVVVLALIPVIQVVLARLVPDPAQKTALQTTLALAVIYATPIGGVASLTGTPANGLLLGIMAQRDIAGWETLTVGRWLLFGVPTSLGMLGLAWLTLRLFRADSLSLTLTSAPPEAPPRQDVRRGSSVAAAGILTAGLLAFFDHAVAAGIGAATYALALFVIRLPSTGEPLMRVGQVVAGIPPRGVLLVVLALGVGYGLERLGTIDWITQALADVLPRLGPVTIVALLIVATVFVTEVVSNTAAALGFWAIAASSAHAAGHEPFLLFVAVGLASQAAFMSPLATPTTAMAFGGLEGTSLKSMLRAGLLLNLLVSVWLIAVCVYWIPRVVGP